MPICPKCGGKSSDLGSECPDDGFYHVEESAIEEAEGDPRIGTLMADKYVILAKISEGGMGAVYRALQLPVERQVALKVLRTELERTHNGRKRFVREARAISRLSHPNTITLHDFGINEESDQPYMVMEFASGQELSDWIHSEDMSTHRIIHVTRQILGALSEAHKNDIVHRDLKPQNIIITEAGGEEDFAKLLDFGIVRLIDERATQGLTRDGEVFGTPFYMSPEQARGKGNVGPASDVYAMGILLHEFFSGKRPFTADTPLQVLFMHLNDPMPELIPRDDLKMPKGILEVVARATEKAQEDRYADAGEMLQSLDEALGITHTTGPFSLPEIAAKAEEARGPAQDADDELARAPTMLLDDFTSPSEEDDEADEQAGEDKTPAKKRSGERSFARTLSYGEAPRDAFIDGDQDAQRSDVEETVTAERPRYKKKSSLMTYAIGTLGLLVVLLVAMGSAFLMIDTEVPAVEDTADRAPEFSTAEPRPVEEVPTLAESEDDGVEDEDAQDDDEPESGDELEEEVAGVATDTDEEPPSPQEVAETPPAEEEEDARGSQPESEPAPEPAPEPETDSEPESQESSDLLLDLTPSSSGSQSEDEKEEDEDAEETDTEEPSSGPAKFERPTKFDRPD